MSSAFGTETNRLSTFFTPIQSVKSTRLTPLFHTKLTAFRTEKESDFFAALIKPVVDLVVAPIYIVKCIADVAQTLYQLLGAIYVAVNNAHSPFNDCNKATSKHLNFAKQRARDALMDAGKIFSFIASFVQYFTRTIASLVYAVSTEDKKNNLKDYRSLVVVGTYRGNEDFVRKDTTTVPQQQYYSF